MKNNPLISIVLPCYNGEKYLAQSIQSCIDQKYTNWELILVDDCSTDTTPAIMREFADKDNRIRIIKNQSNLKLPASLNAGFDNAKGDFFTWTSDDNYYLPDALKELLNTLLEKNADAIYSAFDKISYRNTLIEVCRPEAPENMIYHSVAGASFLYRRSVHEALHGYDTTLFLVEDYDFWLRMYLAGFKIITLDTVLYKYRMHETSLTTTRAKDIEDATYNRVLAIYPSLNKFPRKYHKEYWYYFVKNMLKYPNAHHAGFLVKHCGTILASGALVKLLGVFFRKGFKYISKRLGVVCLFFKYLFSTIMNGGGGGAKRGCK
ncbi:hypothetical protein AGMMS49991_05860 [Spirochaetia bacterium]|nr:hypothetical protein AGMMS49991_05860 [Spirochaetia bacterium]